MNLLPPGVKVHLALGYTDMRKGMDGLAVMVQEVLQQDPFSGHLFVFGGRKANLIKIVFWDGTGLCLFGIVRANSERIQSVPGKLGGCVILSAISTARRR